jgi:phage-related holin
MYSVKIKNMKSAAIASLLFTIFGYNFHFVPNIYMLMYAVVIGMVVDFATGVIKAKMKKEERTSEGYRRTVKKVTQYFTAIGLSLGIQYLVKQTLTSTDADMKYISVFVLVFVLYIEVTSIMENIYEIDSHSTMARFFIRPLLSILKFGLEKNPLLTAKYRIVKTH